MVTDQLLTVAISPLAQSRAASVQVPFGAVSRVVQVVTLDGKLVGPVAAAASAVYVPVKGDADEENASPPSELMTVLVKFTPLLPSRFTRFRVAATRCDDIESEVPVKGHRYTVEHN